MPFNQDYLREGLFSVAICEQTSEQSQIHRYLFFNSAPNNSLALNE
jgi:hypothetical protein